jgi:chromosome partitioning protein
LPKILTFANIKGGVGKTTLCVNMAATLIRKGFKVCAIDADQQKCLEDWILGSNDKYLKKVRLISHEYNFDETLDCDFVLVDTQGSLTRDLAHFFRISSMVIVPCRVSRDDVVGRGWIEAFLNEASDNSLKVQVLTVLNGVNKRSSLLLHIIEQLIEDKILVSKTTISQRVCFGESNVNKTSIITQNRFAEKEFKSLVDEIIQLLKSVD